MKGEALGFLGAGGLFPRALRLSRGTTLGKGSGVQKGGYPRFTGRPCRSKRVLGFKGWVEDGLRNRGRGYHRVEFWRRLPDGGDLGRSVHRSSLLALPFARQGRAVREPCGVDIGRSFKPKFTVGGGALGSTATKPVGLSRGRVGVLYGRGSV